MNKPYHELGLMHGEIFAERNPHIELGKELLLKLVESVYDAQPPTSPVLITNPDFMTGVFQAAILNSKGAKL